jgi:hypothetical protein
LNSQLLLFAFQIPHRLDLSNRSILLFMEKLSACALLNQTIAEQKFSVTYLLTALIEAFHTLVRVQVKGRSSKGKVHGFLAVC